MSGKNKIKASEYIKNRGRLVILQECGNNLRATKNHMKRFCTSSNWNTVMKPFKELLQSQLNYSQALKDEFLHIVKTYFGGLRNER